jgi:hypothetical protein
VASSFLSLLYDRLFQPHPTLNGILQCALCGKMFVSKGRMLELRHILRGKRKRWPEETSLLWERKRAVRHGLHHLKKRQCKRAPSGVFFIPKATPLSARQHGFI